MRGQPNQHQHTLFILLKKERMSSPTRSSRSSPGTHASKLGGEAKAFLDAFKVGGDPLAKYKDIKAFKSFDGEVGYGEKTQDTKEYISHLLLKTKKYYGRISIAARSEKFAEKTSLWHEISHMTLRDVVGSFSLHAKNEEDTHSIDFVKRCLGEAAQGEYDATVEALLLMPMEKWVTDWKKVGKLRDAEKRAKKLQTKVTLFEKKKEEETDVLYLELLDDKLKDLKATLATETKKLKKLRKESREEDESESDDQFPTDGISIFNRNLAETYNQMDESQQAILDQRKRASNPGSPGKKRKKSKPASRKRGRDESASEGEASDKSV